MQDLARCSEPAENVQRVRLSRREGMGLADDEVEGREGRFFGGFQSDRAERESH